MKAGEGGGLRDERAEEAMVERRRDGERRAGERAVRNQAEEAEVVA